MVDLPLWKIWKSVWIIIPNIWKNKKCSKPPIRISIVNSEWLNWHLQSERVFGSIWCGAILRTFPGGSGPEAKSVSATSNGSKIPLARHNQIGVYGIYDMSYINHLIYFISSLWMSPKRARLKKKNCRVPQAAAAGCLPRSNSFINHGCRIDT